MQPDGPETPRRRDEGAEAPRPLTAQPPPALVLLDNYYFRRRNLVRLQEELATAAADLLEADRQLREHIKREGEVADALSVYSLDGDGRLRWRPKPRDPLGWQHYVSPLPLDLERTRDGSERQQ